MNCSKCINNDGYRTPAGVKGAFCDPIFAAKTVMRAEHYTPPHLHQPLPLPNDEDRDDDDDRYDDDENRNNDDAFLMQ